MKINALTVSCLVCLSFLSACNREQNAERSSKKASNYQFTILKDAEALPVTDQQISGTWWSFSTASFLESEIIRIKGEHIDLSEMYFVRNAYIRKTRNYVMRQGSARFTEGSLNHDPLISAAEFGFLPQSVYSGLLPGDSIYDHRKMFEELELRVKEYADPSKKMGTGWKTDVPAIMNKYMGKAPEGFLYQGKQYTPQSFLAFTQINPDDYINLTSFSHVPFNEFFILNIPANWSNANYYNLPLDEFIQNIDHAIETGYTLALDLDASESTFSNEQGIAVLPEKESDKEIILTDIRPEKKVTQESRQADFENFLTTDDHNMHITGKAKDQNGTIYYKVKNSWGINAGRHGSMYMSVPYLRMKAISVLLHKDGLTESTKKSISDLSKSSAGFF